MSFPKMVENAANLETVESYAGDLSLYRDFVHPRGWNRDRVRRFLDGTFKKERAVRTILNADPPFFTSNHAPFFHLKR